MNLRTQTDLTIEAVLAKLKIAEDYYKTLEVLNFKRINNTIVTVKKTNNAESFTRKFFDKFAKEFKTYYKVSNNQYSDLDERRSLGDVFRLAYSYLGNKIELKDIAFECFKLVEEKKIASNYCNNIKKRVYKERGDYNGRYFNVNDIDELGLTKDHYTLLYNHLK